MRNVYYNYQMKSFKNIYFNIYMNKKYLPKQLSRKDRKKQLQMLKKSIKDYKSGSIIHEKK